MGQKADQIERHIGEQRAELGENINELQRKVKNTFDWRAQFKQRPIAMLGLAAGGGLLLSAIIGGRRSRSRKSYLPLTESGDTAPSLTRDGKRRNHLSKASESWRDIKSALIAVTATQLGAAVDAVIPGFSEEYVKVRKGASSQTAQPL